MNHEVPFSKHYRIPLTVELPLFTGSKIEYPSSSSNLDFLVYDYCSNVKFKENEWLELITEKTDRWHTYHDEVKFSVKAPASIYVFHYNKYNYYNELEYRYNEICGTTKII